MGRHEIFLEGLVVQSDGRACMTHHVWPQGHGAVFSRMEVGGMWSRTLVEVEVGPA